MQVSIQSIYMLILKNKWVDFYFSAVFRVCVFFRKAIFVCCVSKIPNQSIDIHFQFKVYLIIYTELSMIFYWIIY